MREIRYLDKLIDNWQRGGDGKDLRTAADGISGS